MLRTMRRFLPQFRTPLINARHCSHGGLLAKAFGAVSPCFQRQQRRNASTSRSCGGYNIYEMASSLVIVVLAITAAVATFGGRFSETTVYTVSEVSGAGDTGRVPCRLNNLGDVAGRAGDSLSGKTRATTWDHGSLRPTNLG